MTAPEQSDATLVAAARAGDREALGALLARHYPGALRLCRRLLGVSHEAQDVAQEAALQALLGLDTLQDPARFGAWLHAIAANQARMALRRRRHLSLDALADGVELVVWPRAAPTPEAVHEAREVHDAIVAALAELPSHERDVALGFFLEGYSYAELAELLGVPLSTVKGRLFKSRRRLQLTLDNLARGALRPDRRPRKELPVSDSDLVEVTIEGIRMSLMTQHRVVVLREKEGRRGLPIWIGPFEADAIALALQGQQPQRPMTHDMALKLLAPFGAEVRRIVVNKILESTFYAEIALEAGGQTHLIDARPSDALALAARTGVPVFVARDIMDVASAEEEEVRRDVEDGAFHLGAPVVMERLPLASGAEGGPLSPFLLATLAYIYNFLDADTGLMGLRLANVRWDERFPTRSLELDGRQLQAVSLQTDDDAAWLVVTPQTWQTITRIAQQVIEREQRLEAALRQDSPPEPPEAGEL